MKRIIPVVLSVLAAVAALSGWWAIAGKEPAATSARPAGGFLEWSVSDLQQQMGKKDFQLINVHVPFQGRISNTDLEVPYDQIDQNIDRLPRQKDARIVLYCMSGRMSEIAAQSLVRQGYTNVVNVRGGMMAWREAGYPLEMK